MPFDIRSWLFAARSSFWLLPIGIGIAFLAAGYLMMEADRLLHDSQIPFVPTITMPFDSARMALSTIAGSMITIASLVFSMTLVALTLVSRQFGPRILMLFMDDRVTQVVLGLFVGTFIFALVVLFRLGADGTGGKVTSLAVLAAAALTVFSLAMMIHFIHHIATRIQADVLVAELGNELKDAVENFAKIEQQEEAVASDDDFDRLDERFAGGSARQITSSSSGYITTVEGNTAARLAADKGLVIKILARPGNFVLAGTPSFAASCDSGAEVDDDLAEELRALIGISERRTPEASIEFEIAALVEVALRALSPGVNDPFTATTCIDRLADGLSALMHRRTDRRVSRDEDGAIRIVHLEEPFSRYLDKAFRAIAQAAGNNVVVMAKLEEILTALSNIAGREADSPQLKALCEDFRDKIASKTAEGPAVQSG